MPTPAEDMYQDDAGGEGDSDQCQELPSSSTQPLVSSHPSHKRTSNGVKRFHSVMHGKKLFETCISFFFTDHKFNDNDSIVAVRVDKTEFPPDKDDSILRAEENHEPEVPVTSPVRQRHRLVGGAGGGYSSGSSEDSRSSVATPSLHHSYETLNMSDCGLSQPHRPAPKPPGGCRFHHHLTLGVTKIDGNW